MEYKMKQCNLCGMSFPDDEYFKYRKTQHERWHTNCKKDKRNTVEGDVIWNIK